MKSAAAHAVIFRSEEGSCEMLSGGKRAPIFPTLQKLGTRKKAHIAVPRVVRISLVSVIPVRRSPIHCCRIAKIVASRHPSNHWSECRGSHSSGAAGFVTGEGGSRHSTRREGSGRSSASPEGVPEQVDRIRNIDGPIPVDLGGLLTG
jgi:hypothetical protein